VCCARCSPRIAQSQDFLQVAGNLIQQGVVRWWYPMSFPKTMGGWGPYLYSSLSFQFRLLKVCIFLECHRDVTELVPKGATVLSFQLLLQLWSQFGILLSVKTLTSRASPGVYTARDKPLSDFLYSFLSEKPSIQWSYISASHIVFSVCVHSEARLVSWNGSRLPQDYWLRYSKRERSVSLKASVVKTEE